MAISIHLPVMQQEAIEGLNLIPHGIYVDATFGRGGHSTAILNQLSNDGRLIAFDQDETAEAHAKTIQDPRFLFIRSNFSALKQQLEKLDLIGKINGILFDLGVSSPQLDEHARGFSFLHDGPLDMRMDNRGTLTAQEFIATRSESVLADVLFYFGEERYSRRIAKAIVFERQKNPITTTKQLAEIIAKAHPRWEHGKHPATRSFQAIRIAVNRELDVLEEVLPQALHVLCSGGRIVVISFHSLEDRMVKHFIQAHAAPKATASLRKLGKMIGPTQDEIVHNPRSRSARMRISEKL